MARLAAALGVVAFILLRPALGDTYCPVHGAAFPAPTNLSSNPVILAAAANLSAILDRVTRDEYQGIEYQANVSSSSIGLASIHDERDIFQHHHTAQLRNDSLGGTNNVTGDTMYRLASISKMFTVLALLMQDGKVCLEDPVTKYVPELAAAAARQKNGSSNGLYPLEEARWDEVTLHALASHLAGTPTGTSTARRCHHVLSSGFVGLTFASSRCADGYKLPPPRDQGLGATTIERFGCIFLRT